MIQHILLDVFVIAMKELMSLIVQRSDIGETIMPFPKRQSHQTLLSETQGSRIE